MSRALADCAHREPRLTGVAFIGLPRLEVVTAGDDIEAGLFAGYAEFEEFWNRKLLECKLKTNHPLAQNAWAVFSPAGGLQLAAACRYRRSCGRRGTQYGTDRLQHGWLQHGWPTGCEGCIGARYFAQARAHWHSPEDDNWAGTCEFHPAVSTRNFDASRLPGFGRS